MASMPALRVRSAAVPVVGETWPKKPCACMSAEWPRATAASLASHASGGSPACARSALSSRHTDFSAAAVVVKPWSLRAGGRRRRRRHRRGRAAPDREVGDHGGAEAILAGHLDLIAPPLRPAAKRAAEAHRTAADEDAAQHLAVGRGDERLGPREAVVQPPAHQHVAAERLPAPDRIELDERLLQRHQHARLTVAGGGQADADARVAPFGQHRGQVRAQLVQELPVAARAHHRQDQMRRRLDDPVHPQRALHQLVRRRPAVGHDAHDVGGRGVEARVGPRLAAPLLFRHARDQLVDARGQRRARRRRRRIVVAHRLRPGDGAATAGRRRRASRSQRARAALRRGQGEDRGSAALALWGRDDSSAPRPPHH